MTKSNNSILILLVGALIAALVFVFIQNPLEDVTSPPKIVSIANYNNNFCPEGISFNTFFADNESMLAVFYRNDSSKSASLSATLYSPDILSKYNDNFSDYNSSTSKVWYVSGNSPQKFDFKLTYDPDNQPNDINISIELSCFFESAYSKNTFCGKITNCCNYVKDSTPASSYILKSDKC